MVKIEMPMMETLKTATVMVEMVAEEMNVSTNTCWGTEGHLGGENLSVHLVITYLLNMEFLM